MNDIVIRRKHGKMPAEARTSAELMAAKLKEKLDIDSAWEGNLLRFKRPGVSGELMLETEEVALRIHLGALFAAFKPAIESKVQKFFDENFAG